MSINSLKEAAKAIGYSPGTVSRAINHRKGVSEKTRQEILDALDNIGYHPNRIAQSLVRKKSNLIAVIVPEFANDFLGSIVMIMEESMEKQGYHMLLFSTNWDIKSEKEKIRLAMSNQVDGIIIKPSTHDVRHIEKLDLPVVMVSQTHTGNMSCVDIDNQKAAYDATQYLIDLGYKNIAFISSVSSNIIYKLRYEGYKKALCDSGIDTTHYFECENGLQYGYPLMEKIMSGSDKIDAVFSCDDYFVVGMLTYAKEHGISVPDELGLIGFNNTIISQLSQIDMTTVSQPKEQIGQYAVRMMIDIIESGERSAQKITLSSTLIPRSTTRKKSD